MAKETNPLLNRYPVNSRFIGNGIYKNQVPMSENKIDYGESVTDKETYRLTMASKRGALGSINHFGDFSNSKAYMFPDGQYDAQKDFSILLRKDLTVVELDEIINSLTEKQKAADADLKSEIEEQLALANEKKEEMQKVEVTSNKESSE